jgi:hypothetical protein
MKCIDPLTTLPGGVCFEVINRTGAGQVVHAPERHADRAVLPMKVHTVGGVGVRDVCPLTSLLGRVVGVFIPAIRFDGEVQRNGRPEAQDALVSALRDGEVGVLV